MLQLKFGVCETLIVASAIFFACGAVADTSDYVAVGSSFAAAPGVGARDVEAPLLCLRSKENYPHLLAKKRKLDLSDRTCSGATIEHLIMGGQFLQTAQLDALRPATKLVTVTIGGNDVWYVGNLMAWSRATWPDAIPWIFRRLLPAAAPLPVVAEKFNQLESKMLEITRVVRERSPAARLVFVDEATILPDSGECPAHLPLSPDQLNQAKATAAKLQEITANVARLSGAILVQASELTKGHDVCAKDPWVYGWQLPDSPVSWGPMAFHPKAEAMRAIAEAIHQSLGTP